MPVSSCQWRVSCRIGRPDVSTAACRCTSYRTARSTERSEFTFLVSVRVPNVCRGPSVSSPVSRGASERFTSQRSEPCSIRTSLTPRPSSRSRSCATYALATSGTISRVPRIGLVTISMSGMPARL